MKPKFFRAVIALIITVATVGIYFWIDAIRWQVDTQIHIPNESEALR